MSNVEVEPVEMRCGERVDDRSVTGLPDVDVLTPRDVPLGGPRTMSVRRTLPQRARTLVGAWCFADHYGPDDVTRTGGMDVPPHPHTGLQTASWLFSGEVEHRDSLGNHAIVRPGELNLMTGGYGIAHSEVSTPHTTVLHGVQLWVALPEAHRDTERDFQHHVPAPVCIGGVEIRVFLGSLAGGVSPVPTFTPLLGAEITLEPGAAITLAVNPAFEHGLLVDGGPVHVAGALLRPAELGYVHPGIDALALRNTSIDRARTILLGGTPFEEEIVMWWNFVGRSHDDIVRARQDWVTASDRFGLVDGYPGDRLAAPALPHATLRPRRSSLRAHPPSQGTSMSRSSADPLVQHDAGSRRYEIMDGDHRIGFVSYRDRGEQRVFVHTEIDDAHTGHGLAARLVQEALTDTRAAGKRVVAVCSYVARFLRRHDDFAEVTDPVTPDVLQWLDGRSDTSAVI